MGRINKNTTWGMTTRVVLFKVDADDTASIKNAAYDGEIEIIKSGIRTFRRSDNRVFVVNKIAVAGIGVNRYVLAVVHTPGNRKDAQLPFADIINDFADDVIKSWPVNLELDGTLTVPALDADNTIIGTRVKNNLWPDTWHLYTITDNKGDPFADPPVAAGLPTGARCILHVIA